MKLNMTPGEISNVLFAHVSSHAFELVLDHVWGPWTSQ